MEKLCTITYNKYKIVFFGNEKGKRKIKIMDKKAKRTGFGSCTEDEANTIVSAFVAAEKGNDDAHKWCRGWLAQNMH